MTTSRRRAFLSGSSSFAVSSFIAAVGAGEAAAAWVPMPSGRSANRGRSRASSSESLPQLPFLLLHGTVDAQPQCSYLYHPQCACGEGLRFWCWNLRAAREDIDGGAAAIDESPSAFHGYWDPSSLPPSWETRGAPYDSCPQQDATGCESRTHGRRAALNKLASLVLAGVTAGGFGEESTSAASTTASTTAMMPDYDRGQGRPNDSKSSTLSEASVLRARIETNLLSQPTYGMDGPDVLYPPWFQGSWRATSTTLNVSAPCGIMLFGGNSTYQRAREEMGTSLAYSARFVPYFAGSDDAGGDAQGVVADREYNVRSIAQAAMGPNSVVNVDKATSNEFVCTLLSGSNSGENSNNNNMFRVNMLTVQRKQETIGSSAAGELDANFTSDPRTFACAEVVQEVIRPIGTSTASAIMVNPILKQIETISVYTARIGDNPNVIKCIQRTASYLVPSQNDPLMAQLSRASHGLPVDVRHYSVTYRKVDEEKS